MYEYLPACIYVYHVCLVPTEVWKKTGDGCELGAGNQTMVFCS